MGRCLDKTTLEQLARGSLPGAAATEVEAHIETCRRCAEALAKLPIGDDLVARIRELEAAREEIAPALSALADIEQHLTTTLYP